MDNFVEHWMQWEAEQPDPPVAHSQPIPLMKEKIKDLNHMGKLIGK